MLRAAIRHERRTAAGTAAVLVRLPYAFTLLGPAAFTDSLTPDSYFLKFSANMSASWVALAS